MSAGGRGPWGRPSRGGARSLRGRTEGDHGPSAFLPTPQVNQIVKKGCNFQNHVPPAILKVLKIFGNSCLATACRLFCTKWSLMILLSFYMAPVARIRAAPVSLLLQTPSSPLGNQILNSVSVTIFLSW